MASVWIVVALVFFVAVICTLLGIIVYMLFFKKVQVLLFDSNGRGYKIISATKKGKELWFAKKNWTAKEGSFERFGKKNIYFAQQVDENSITSYCLKGKELKADEHWLEALNKSYYNSAKKFKFGLDKYKELISLIVTTCFICIMVLGSVKYVTDLDPVEAQAIQNTANALANVAQHYESGAKANQAIVNTLQPQQPKEPPK